MLREKLRSTCWKLPSTAQCVLEAAQHCIVWTAARHAARHSTHSTDRQLYESGQVSLKDRCPLVCMGLYKAAWGQVVLRYICVLVCCCKQLDACMNTACQGICININTLLKSFLIIYFIISLSLYSSSRSAVRVQKGNLSLHHCISSVLCCNQNTHFTQSPKNDYTHIYSHPLSNLLSFQSPFWSVSVFCLLNFLAFMPIQLPLANWQLTI